MKDHNVVGITTVAGNVEIEKVIANVQEVLRITERTDIPVYRGADKPLVADPINAAKFHGEDGLGNY